jgi:hypothetical protein
MAEIPVSIISLGYSLWKGLIGWPYKVNKILTRIIIYLESRLEQGDAPSGSSRWTSSRFKFSTYLDVEEVFGENRRAVIDGDTGTVELAAKHFS